MSETIYYVYGYVRLDTNTYFYIGKGRGSRYKMINRRSNHFMNIINKVPCVVEILYENLTNEMANLIEVETIDDLVFNEGYSIEIKDFNTKNEKYLVNQTWGGEGASGRIVKEQTKSKISRAKKGRLVGENNPNYGNRLSDEAKNRISEANKINSKGKNNGMYGKHHKDSTKEKIGRANGKKVYCVQLNKYFPSITYAGKYIRDLFGIKFTKRTLIRKLKYEDGKYGKVVLNGEEVILQWEYA